jgi:hypothetical protein
MITQIDHIVVLVRDLGDAMTGATDAGFKVVEGGEHAGGETRNALISFRDGSYIELLAFVHPDAPGAHYFSERFRLGTGFGGFALLSDDLERDVAAIMDRGVTYPEPTSLGRRRPDGQFLEWRMSLPAELNPGKGFPFLIEDTSDRALRVSRAERHTSHRNGVIGVAGVAVVVPDLEEVAPAYQAILGAPPVSAIVGVAGKGILRLRLTGDSGQWIALMQAIPGSRPEASYRRFGSGLFAVSLRTEPATDVYPGDGDLIEPDLMGNALFYVT